MTILFRRYSGFPPEIFEDGLVPGSERQQTSCLVAAKVGRDPYLQSL